MLRCWCRTMTRLPVYRFDSVFSEIRSLGMCKFINITVWHFLVFVVHNIFVPYFAFKVLPKYCVYLSNSFAACCLCYSEKFGNVWFAFLWLHIYLFYICYSSNHRTFLNKLHFPLSDGGDMIIICDSTYYRSVFLLVLMRRKPSQDIYFVAVNVELRHLESWNTHQYANSDKVRSDACMDGCDKNNYGSRVSKTFIMLNSFCWKEK